MDAQPNRPTDDTIRRIQCEFLEMPGLRLTEPQARRLWGLDAADCSKVLSLLVASGFLVRARDGSFMRLDRAVPAKASLPLPAGNRKKAPPAA